MSYNLQMNFVETRHSLSWFLNIIKSQFDEIIGYHDYTVEAEVKSIKQNRSYYYIDLVEISNGKILDSARANIFNPSVMKSFMRQVWMLDVQDLVWKKILITVKPSFHKTYGFSVNITKIHAEFLIWSLEKKKWEDVEYLKNKEVFELNHKTHIWEPSFNIAVISWEKSEWFRDFQTILNESGFVYNLDLFPSLVNGEKASLEVLEQLKNIQNKISNGTEYNAIAVIRWGWGSEWMNWTNDRELCEYVCNMSIPIISAVGHTVDQSILDMVAKYDCKTPSEAAQIIIDIYEDYSDNLSAEYDYIKNTIDDTFQKYALELQTLSKEIPFHIGKKVQIYKMELAWLIIEKKIHYQLQYANQSLQNLYKNISSNNPEKILGKWYSLVLDEKWKTVKMLDIWKKYKLLRTEGEYEVEVI